MKPMLDAAHHSGPSHQAHLREQKTASERRPVLASTFRSLACLPTSWSPASLKAPPARLARPQSPARAHRPGSLRGFSPLGSRLTELAQFPRLGSCVRACLSRPELAHPVSTRHVECLSFARPCSPATVHALTLAPPFPRAPELVRRVPLGAPGFIKFIISASPNQVRLKVSHRRHHPAGFCFRWFASAVFLSPVESETAKPSRWSSPVSPPVESPPRDWPVP